MKPKKHPVKQFFHASAFVVLGYACVALSLWRAILGLNRY